MTAKVTTEIDDSEGEEGKPQEAEPSLQSLLSELTGKGGWADLDSGTLGQMLKKSIDGQRAQMRKSALQFRACFRETEAGRAVLEMLLNQTLRSVTWPVHAMTDPQMLMAYGVWREGQNAFVASIIEAIAAADNVDIKPRSEI